MSDKKQMTTLRWIIVAVSLVILSGLLIAMLISGHEPSLHFIGTMIFVFLFVGFAIWANLLGKKADRLIAEQKIQAVDRVARKDFAGAIRLWKELLPQVGEPHVKELMAQLEGVYQKMESPEGKTRLLELQKLYDDFFDMTRRLKQLDAKGRIMRQSLADKICETVGNLPEPRSSSV